ncbi:MAG: c-type cytochrome [Armatimonadetes bacterium]|nr:c-type cytochrome [Akkermansiaceae bacterium]
MRIHEPKAVNGLVERLAKATDPAKHLELFSSLCRLYFLEGEWKGDSWGTRPDTRGPYYQPETWSESSKIAVVLKDQLAKASPSEAPALIREMSRNRIQFNEALERLTGLVKENSALLPDLITQLAAVETLPADGISWLLTALRGDWPPATLSLAVATLAKTDSKEACLASIDALEKLATTKDAGNAADGAKTAFLTAPKLENHHALLEERAAAMNGPSARWADAGLLALAERKDGSPEAKSLSRKALESGWPDAKRCVQIMEAIRITGSHLFDDQVAAAMESSDAAVADAAKKTADSLKLEKKGEDKTPLVGSMTPEQAIEEVMKTKGSAELGAQMFTKQGCMACHAVHADEVQKGPYLGTIAQTYKRSDLAANILDPGKTIAQGFASEMITLHDGSAQMVFVTLESADLVKARNIAGQEFTWKTADIATRAKLPTSMMPPGLANNMTIRQFASLLDYLESLSKK